MDQEQASHEPAAPSSKVTISESALLEDMGGEAVILNVNNEHYYGLDQVGMNFWHWLKEERDIDRVLERAQASYGVDEDTLRKDLGAFVVELTKAGLLSFDESET